MRNILLFGPQGSGKGTQGEKLSVWLGLPLIVTGQIFRWNMKNDTALGKVAKQYINAGHLVPDEITNQMIQNRLRQADCAKGFVLDGFPRNLVQAGALDKNQIITHLLHINISDLAATQRITGRRSCLEHGHVYHLLYNPPVKPGVCDIDGSTLQQRDDDTAEALQQRLAIYHSETEPVLQHYQSVTHAINGEQTIEQVWLAVKSIFQK